ncbi:hypothetical protein HDV62DRAFT_210949 [Trichoderma sp. SZMC 28011]
MDRATLAWYSSVLVYTGLVDRITTPLLAMMPVDGLRARGNWHLAMLAANRARALRFPMNKVGSVSPAATALLSTAQHRCCCKVSDPNKDPGKDGTVRMRSWITEYSTAEFSKPLCRVDTQMCVSPLQRPIPSARNHCYADTTLMRQ